MQQTHRVPVLSTEQAALPLRSKRNWRRSSRYLWLKLKRMRACPRHVALGAAVGVFVAILPIPGLQLIAAAALSWMVGGHGGAAVVGTFAANPITYPLIWIASYIVGAKILGAPPAEATFTIELIAGLVEQAQAQAPSSKWSQAVPLLTTLMVGALPLAAVSALGAYVLVRRVLSRSSRSVALEV